MLQQILRRGPTRAQCLGHEERTLPVGFFFFGAALLGSAPVVVRNLASKGQKEPNWAGLNAAKFLQTNSGHDRRPHPK